MPGCYLSFAGSADGSLAGSYAGPGRIDPVEIVRLPVAQPWSIAGAYGGRLAAQQPTPGLGIYERISIYSYLLWVVVLAVVLRRRAEAAESGTR